jgi:hypothetical protein
MWPPPSSKRHRLLPSKLTQCKYFHCFGFTSVQEYQPYLTYECMGRRLKCRQRKLSKKNYDETYFYVTIITIIKCVLILTSRRQRLNSMCFETCCIIVQADQWQEQMTSHWKGHAQFAIPDNINDVCIPFCIHIVKLLLSFINPLLVQR